MAQLAFFGNDRRTLLDDHTGSVVYLPALVRQDIADAWRDVLTNQVAWRRERRRMYHRDVDVPRLVAAYRLDDETAPQPLRQAAPLVAEAADGVAFTDVGLNLYRDGGDSVAPHNDHLYEIVAGFPIALLSLGATRRMTIRSKERPRRILDLDLESGSLLIMSYQTQKHYDHGIPKQRERIGPRISVAFRVRPRI